MFFINSIVGWGVNEICPCQAATSQRGGGGFYSWYALAGEGERASGLIENIGRRASELAQSSIKISSHSGGFHQRAGAKTFLRVGPFIWRAVLFYSRAAHDPNQNHCEAMGENFSIASQLKNGYVRQVMQPARRLCIAGMSAFNFFSIWLWNEKRNNESTVCAYLEYCEKLLFVF